METVKIKWKVQEAPTGFYASFSQRGWPSAQYQNARQDMCAHILCEENYRPSAAKSGEHPPLTVQIADHSQTPFKWLTLKARFTTLALAKEAVRKCIDAMPEIIPTDLREEIDLGETLTTTKEEDIEKYLVVKNKTNVPRCG